MNIKKIIFGLIGVTVLVGCKPTVSESTPSSEYSQTSVSTPSSGTGTSWVAPTEVWTPTGKLNFTQVPFVEGSDEWYNIPGLGSAETFWSSIDSSLRGSALSSALRTRMQEVFTPINYDTVTSAIRIMDADPDKPGYVLSLYDLKSHNASGFTTWNREHTFPQSRLGATTSDKQPNIATDAANIFACDWDLNEQRSNWPYGEWNYEDSPKDYYKFTTVNRAGQHTDSILRRNLFSPTAMVRGEVARAQLYMTTMYPTLKISAVFPGVETMLKWALEFPPTVERDGQRQTGLVQYQKARNPFIDNRNFACYIWGNTNTHTARVCTEAGIDF